MAVMSMKEVLNAVNDKTIIKIYRGKQFITKGNWYQDNILNYIDVKMAVADLDDVTNVCKVVLR
jgi:hypothetical protein